MTRENANLVREAVEAYHRADTVRLLELVHPDLEWTYLNPQDPTPQPEVCHGRDQLVLTVRAGQIVAMRAFRDQAEASQFAGIG